LLTVEQVAGAVAVVRIECAFLPRRSWMHSKLEVWLASLATVAVEEVSARIAARWWCWTMVAKLRPRSVRWAWPTVEREPWLPHVLEVKL